MLIQHVRMCMYIVLQVRVDTGIVEGSTISMYYDPMISKVSSIAMSLLQCVN